MEDPEDARSDDELAELRALQISMTVVSAIPSRPPQRRQVYELIDAARQDLEAQRSAAHSSSSNALSSVFAAHVRQGEAACLSLSDAVMFRAAMLQFLDLFHSTDQIVPGWRAALSLALFADHDHKGVKLLGEIENVYQHLDDKLVDIMLDLYRHNLYEPGKAASGWETTLHCLHAEAARRKHYGIQTYLPRSIEFLEARRYRATLRTKASVALSGTRLPVELCELVGDFLVQSYGFDAAPDDMDERWRAIPTDQWSSCPPETTLGGSGCCAHSCPKISKVRWEAGRRRWLVMHGKHFATRCPLGRYCPGHHDASLPVLL